MTVFLTVIAAIATAGVLIFGIIRASLWIADTKSASNSEAWKEGGHGNTDGYSDFGGGDAGGGGGD